LAFRAAVLGFVGLGLAGFLVFLLALMVVAPIVWCVAAGTLPAA